MVARGGAEPGDTLSVTVADLTSDDGWPGAVDGCDYVLHVASPFPPDEPSDANKVIMPAGLGTLRILRAARHAGVERVVPGASFATIAHGHGKVDREFTEKDWTNLDGEGVTAYVKSKVLAERAAWDFIKNEGGQTELSVINPTATFGPALQRRYLRLADPRTDPAHRPAALMPIVGFPRRRRARRCRHPRARHDPSRRGR